MITFDSSGVGITAAGGTSATWQHVIGTSATALIVGVSFSGGSPNTASRTVTVGSKTMFSLGVLASSPTAWTELFGILGPSTGAQAINVKTSVAVAKSGNSVAYRGVVSFGSVSLVNPASAYTLSQPSTPGNWMVAVFGTATAVNIAAQATTGTMRYVASSTPTVAIVDELSSTSSTTLTLNAATTPPSAVIAISMSPVTNNGWNYTGNTLLGLTTSFSAEAAVTSVRQATARLVVQAAASADIQVIGNRDFATNLSVTAVRTATARMDWLANASLGLTATATARREPTLWIFNSALTATATPTATASVTPAVIPPPAEHSRLRYVGRYPDTEGAITPRSYAVAANDKTKVTLDYINKAVDSLVYPLAKIEYVDQQDRKKALKTDVTAADELYFPASGHGLATLGTDGFVTSTHIPSGVSVNRAANGYPTASPYSVNLTSGTTSSADYRALLLGSITIAYPGFPFVVMPFGWVTGSNPTGTLKSRWAGTGNTGRILVMPTTGPNIFCGWAACSGSQKLSSYPITPAVSMNVMSQKFTTDVTLGVYGSVMVEATGRSYTFSGGSFHVIILPAV